MRQGIPTCCLTLCAGSSLQQLDIAILGKDFNFSLEYLEGESELTVFPGKFLLHHLMGAVVREGTPLCVSV